MVKNNASLSHDSSTPCAPRSALLPTFGQIVLVALIFWCSACASSTDQTGHPGITGIRQKNSDTLVANQNLVTGIRAVNDNGTINVIVEVPAGTNEKWEVNEEGVMVREFTGDKPRVIRYLPYPGNYGMIPRTLLDPKDGGDNAPLDAIVLGSSVPRGHVIKAYPIGVLRMLDGGEQDDKILAVQADSHFKSALDVEKLEEQFPGTVPILKTWFSNYAGKSQQIVLGFGSRASAIQIISIASKSFEARN